MPVSSGTAKIPRHHKDGDSDAQCKHTSPVYSHIEECYGNFARDVTQLRPTIGRDRRSSLTCT